MSRLLAGGLRYEVGVGGSGPPLLLVHGFTGRGASWAPHLGYLRRVATTIQVDLLGHGRSDCPADAARYAVERQAADMGEIIRQVAGGPVDVLGYSFGARIALALVIRDPSAVRRLILESPSAGIAGADERAARRAADEVLASELERGGLSEFVARWDSLPLFATHSAMPEARRRRLHTERLRNNTAGLAGSLRGAGQGAMTPMYDRLHLVAVPTLVVCGALDPARARGELVASGIAGSTLELVDGAGHTPHLEAPAAFRAAVLPFITAPDRARSK